jgi:hypothetical protein
MRRNLHALSVFALLATVMTAQQGCTHAAKTEGTPEDFSFGVVVPSAVREANLEPGWIVVDADGSVREYAGEVTRATRLPRRATTISRDQLDALHEQLAHASVLTYGSVGEPVGDASAALVRSGSIGVWWSANGRRRSLLLSPALAEDAAAIEAIGKAYRDVRTQTWGTAP